MAFDFNPLTGKLDLIRTIANLDEYGFIKVINGALSGGHTIHDVIDDQMMALSSDCLTGFKYNSTSEKVEVWVANTKLAEFG